MIKQEVRPFPNKDGRRDPAQGGAKKQTVLITGASSGIGWEFGHVFAQNGYNVILTARREERLVKLRKELKEGYRTKVLTVACDLSKKGAPEHIFNRIKAKGINVDVLVNNAGFGTFGEFAQTDLNTMTEMIQVNITSLMQLTKLYTDEMIKRKAGHILNVSSMGAFVPGPLMSVYFASKAFVQAFSEAIANELKGTGVHVTILCPGPVKSEFALVAKHKSPAETMHIKIPSARETAEFGFKAMKKNETIAITGITNRIIPYVWRILPRKTSTKIVRAFQDSLVIQQN